MSKQELQYLQQIEQHGAENGWVAPLTQEDTAYLVHFRAVCKRYNIIPSKATRLEYDYLQNTRSHCGAMAPGVFSKQ